MSIYSNYYGLVIVDDFSRFTWTLFIVTKDDAYIAFNRLAKVIQNEKNYTIGAIQIDHRKSFKIEDFCENFSIKHNFLTPRTPQKNEV